MSAMICVPCERLRACTNLLAPSTEAMHSRSAGCVFIWLAVWPPSDDRVVRDTPCSSPRAEVPFPLHTGICMCSLAIDSYSFRVYVNTLRNQSKSSHRRSSDQNPDKVTNTRVNMVSMMSETFSHRPLLLIHTGYVSQCKTGWYRSRNPLNPKRRQPTTDTVQFQHTCAPASQTSHEIVLIASI